MATKTKPTSSDTQEPTEVAPTTSAAQLDTGDSLDFAEEQQMSAALEPFEITLEEFMQKLSARDNRIELIAGFYYTEKRDGHIKDYESNFQARFVAFTQLVIED